jgi:hypothetical protein
MKIAYYEEQTCHLEILATFIEHYCNDDIIIAYNDKDTSNWINYYKTYLNFIIKKNDEFEKDIDMFDKIIIGSYGHVNKISQLLENKQNINNKIIFIVHSKNDMNNVFANNINFFVLSPLLNDIYVFPLNNVFNQINNIKYKYENNVISIIGRFKFDNRDVNDLINLIKNNNDNKFMIWIFVRHKKFIPIKLLSIANEYPNKLCIYLKMSTEQMITFIQKTKYMCPFIKKNKIYHNTNLCGLLPLAYNFNTPLLLDKKTNDIYNFKSTIIYNNKICEIINHATTMSYDDYEKLVNNVIEEKNEIIKKNKITLSKHLTII